LHFKRENEKEKDFRKEEEIEKVETVNSKKGEEEDSEKKHPKEKDKEMMIDLYKKMKDFIDTKNKSNIVLLLLFYR
jgi:hypothetical protein